MSTHATRRGAISTVAAALATIASAGSLASASTTEVDPTLPLISAHRAAYAEFNGAVSRGEVDAAHDAFDALVLSVPTSPEGAVAKINYVLNLPEGEEYWTDHASDLLASLRDALVAWKAE